LESYDLGLWVEEMIKTINFDEDSDIVALNTGHRGNFFPSSVSIFAAKKSKKVY